MNTPSSPVVVGVAEKQPVAVRFAVEEALRAATSLRIVHCYSLPAAVAELYLGDDLLSKLRAAGESVLDEAKLVVEAQPLVPNVEYMLGAGPPGNMLLEQARTAKSVVIGSDDVPWFDRMLGGAVASYLVRKADCAVIVVPEHPFPFTPTGGVVVTIDGDTSAAGPLRFGFEQADARNEELHVLHAAPLATTRLDFENHQANVREVVAGWQEQYPDVHVNVSSASGKPFESCIAATANASLIVIGRPHGHTRPFGLARPLAVQVLREARCPVAVVPAGYRGA